nr:hypothetical protein CFP56_58221 [Quercus suber]
MFPRRANFNCGVMADRIHDLRMHPSFWSRASVLSPVQPTTRESSTLSLVFVAWLMHLCMDMRPARAHPALSFYQCAVIGPLAKRTAVRELQLSQDRETS